MKECENHKIKVMNLKFNNQINNNNNDNDLSTDVFPVARNRLKSLFNEFKKVEAHPSAPAPAINFSEKNINLPKFFIHICRPQSIYYTSIISFTHRI